MFLWGVGMQLLQVLNQGGDLRREEARLRHMVCLQTLARETVSGTDPYIEGRIVNRQIPQAVGQAGP